tara:strand:- start:1003 stop:1389 length:387 start_codon:yes stop_codon:yes gene_type:complete
MISFLTSLLLFSSKINNFSNNKPEITNKSLDNELKKPYLESDNRKGYDETRINKNNFDSEKEQLMNIKINYHKNEFLKKLEIIKKQNQKYNIDHPNNPLLNNILNSIFIQEMNEKSIWQDIIDDWNDE